MQDKRYQHKGDTTSDMKPATRSKRTSTIANTMASESTSRQENRMTSAESGEDTQDPKEGPSGTKRRYPDNAPLHWATDDEEVPPTQPRRKRQRPDTEGRLQTVEKGITSLQAAMDAILQKLGDTQDLENSRETSPEADTPPRDRGRARRRGATAGRPSGRAQEPPKERATRETPHTREDSISHAMARTEFDIGKLTGKPTRPKNWHMTPRPYMYLPREILTAVKEREAYDALTMTEYFLGSHAMLMELGKRGVDTAEYAAHFVEVAEDANQNAWENVVKWSNVCFDLVEEGQARWGEPIMERKRITIAWRAARRDTANPTTPCHAYNTTRCTLPDGHSTTEGKKAHVCIICYYSSGLKACKHSALWCQKKKALEEHRFKRETNNRRDNNRYSPNRAEGRRQNSPRRNRYNKKVQAQAKN